MALVPAKCPNCGAGIKVDPEGKAAICEYCGTPFIVEESIKNYYITQNITQNITQQVTVVKEQSEFDKLLDKFKNNYDREERSRIVTHMKYEYPLKYQTDECKAELNVQIMLSGWHPESEDYISDIIIWSPDDFDKMIMEPLRDAYRGADSEQEKSRLQSKINYTESRCKHAKEHIEKIDAEEDIEFEEIKKNPQRLHNYNTFYNDNDGITRNTQERFFYHDGVLYHFVTEWKHRQIVDTGKFSREKYGRKYIAAIKKKELYSCSFAEPRGSYNLAREYVNRGIKMIEGFMPPEPEKENVVDFIYRDESGRFYCDTVEMYEKMAKKLCPVCGSPIKPGGMITLPKCKKCKKNLIDMFEYRDNTYYLKK